MLQGLKSYHDFFCFFIFVLSLIHQLSLRAQEIEYQKKTCLEQPASEPILYLDEFDWNISLSSLIKKYNEIYSSGKRLRGRAFIKDKKVLMPTRNFGRVQKFTRLNSRFLKSVTKTIEEAFKRGYIHALFFPDMGHSHLFIPKRDYEILSKIPVENQNIFYEKAFELPGLKILYHTAEQLRLLDDNEKLLDDRIIQWRFYTRNLVGSNEMAGRLEFLHNTESRHNTSRKYSNDYIYYGAGFSLSASTNGCFPFKVKGKTYYFDLSFRDIGPRGGGVGTHH